MRYAEVKVMVEQTWLVPLVGEEGEETTIDNRPLADVVREWFRRFDINSHHATRSTYRVSNGDRIEGTPKINIINTEA